jgi:aryl-alcohol dehydrogenase-like predicted oxidoreductase
MNRLVLGTAQLGMVYGIANKTGQPNTAVARDIVKTAWENGIYKFDTAQGYGESEQILGRTLYELGISGKVQIITKMHPAIDHLNKESLKNSVVESMDNLKVSNLYGLMLHREEFLDYLEEGLDEVLREFIYDGIANHIGVSVYSPEYAQKALGSDIIDMIQLPANILDRRFFNAGIFQSAIVSAKEIFIRSIFLQGLLLIEPNELRAGMDYAKPVLNDFRRLSEEIGMTRQEMALIYAKYQFPEANIIFGAETAKQVKDNVSIWTLEIPESSLQIMNQCFTDMDEKIVNPILWPN